MMKKKQAHSGEMGIMDTARGYAMNAKPGPERDHAEKHNSSIRKIESRNYSMCAILFLQIILNVLCLVEGKYS